VRIWPAALFAPLPLLAVAPALPEPRAAALAFGAYLLGNLALWPAESVAVPLAALIAMHVVGAALFAAFVALAAEAARRWSGWSAALVYPTLTAATWFAIGEMSPQGSYGNPAYSMADLLPLMQLSAFTGLAGLTFLMALLPAALAVAWYRRTWRMSWERIAVVPPVIFAVALVAGAARMLMTPGASQPAVSIGLGASDRMLELSDTSKPAEAAQAIEQFAPIVTRLAAAGARVVVLPEKLVGAAPGLEAEVTHGFADMARLNRVWLVVGINEIEREPKRNLALVLSPSGGLVTRYYKRHPAPSLEGGYAPGRDAAIFDTPWGPIAVAIARDLDFPGLGRELAARGARFVLVPAWDWVGAGQIHERMAVALGIEAGLSVARAAREGTLSLTDSRGRTIAARSSLHDDPALVVASLPPGTGPTFYVRHGDWFGWLCVVLAAAALVRFAVGVWYDRSRVGGLVEWRHIEVPVAHEPGEAGQPEPTEQERQDDTNPVLHYRR
jgi:apolipoprotein N-acyltransferase